MRAHDGLGGRLPGPQREAIEAATHTGERALAEQAFERFERFEHERIPIMVGRYRLLYGMRSTAAGAPTRTDHCGPPTRC